LSAIAAAVERRKLFIGACGGRGSSLYYAVHFSRPVRRGDGAARLQGLKLWCGRVELDGKLLQVRYWTEEEAAAAADAALLAAGKVTMNGGLLGKAAALRRAGSWRGGGGGGSAPPLPHGVTAAEVEALRPIIIGGG
jgi:hypothetical protein